MFKNVYKKKIYKPTSYLNCYQFYSWPLVSHVFYKKHIFFCLEMFIRFYILLFFLPGNSYFQINYWPRYKRKWSIEISYKVTNCLRNFGSSVNQWFYLKNSQYLMFKLNRIRSTINYVKMNTKVYELQNKYKVRVELWQVKRTRTSECDYSKVKS